MFLIHKVKLFNKPSKYGMDTLKKLRQGKYFEIEINENDETKAKDKIEDMCKKLLVNLIIEDFEISKI